MITITEDGGVVTLINVFSCEPQNQQHLIDAWIRATEDTLGKLPGIISASPASEQRRKSGCQLRPMEEQRELGKPLPHWQ